MEGENLHPLQQTIDPLPQNQQLCHFLGGQLVVQEKRQQNFLHLDGEMLTVVR